MYKPKLETVLIVDRNEYTFKETVDEVLNNPNYFNPKIHYAIAFDTDKVFSALITYQYINGKIKNES